MALAGVRALLRLRKSAQQRPEPDAPTSSSCPDMRLPGPEGVGRRRFSEAWADGARAGTPVHPLTLSNTCAVCLLIILVPIDRQQELDRFPLEALAVSRQRDLECAAGTAVASRCDLVIPAAARAPEIRLERLDADRPGIGVPRVTGAVPAELVSLGDIGPAGAAAVDLEMFGIDVRPAVDPLGTEIGQHAHHLSRRQAGRDQGAYRRQGHRSSASDEQAVTTLR